MEHYGTIKCDDIAVITNKYVNICLHINMQYVKQILKHTMKLWCRYTDMCIYLEKWQDYGWSTSPLLSTPTLFLIFLQRP